MQSVNILQQKSPHYFMGTFWTTMEDSTAPNQAPIPEKTTPPLHHHFLKESRS